MTTATNLITLDSLRKNVPSIFARNPHPKMSERYTFLSTADLLEPLIEKEHWTITSASQRIARRRDPRFTRHMVRVRPPNSKPMLGGIHPEVLLTNSHDGQSQFLAYAGLYRLVCSNGLVISTLQFAGIKVKHIGDVEEALDRLRLGIHSASQSVGDVERMSKKKLKPAAQYQFARKAAELVYDDIDFDTKVLLEARRDEDAGDNVWSVYNRVQENITRGGIRIQHQAGSQRAATLRGVSHIGRSIDFNLNLWQLAVKAAA